MDFPTRNEQIRQNISKAEAISRIDKAYQAQYDTNNIDFDVHDQLLACETVSEAKPTQENLYKKQEVDNENVYVAGSGIDSGKLTGNFEITQGKIQMGS